MALSDYRLCDVCGSKAFYDSNLNYEEETQYNTSRPPFRNVGVEQKFSTPELLLKWGMRLDYLGDWAVICHDCAKTHKCIIVPIEETKP